LLERWEHSAWGAAYLLLRVWYIRNIKKMNINVEATTPSSTVQTDLFIALARLGNQAAMISSLEGSHQTFLNIVVLTTKLLILGQDVLVDLRKEGSHGWMATTVLHGTATLLLEVHAHEKKR
jgi:hypothetical protein